MSNYHVTTTGKDERSANVIFHIPIPVGNNSATPTKSWRDSVAEFIKIRNQDGTFATFASSLESIEAGELGQLQSGELFEHSDVVKFSAADNNAQKKTKIEAKFAEVSTEILNDLQEKLKFWGFAGDAP